MAVGRRFGCLALAALLLTFSSLEAGKPSPPPPPPTPNWQYLPELGGWLDGNTGLVWGLNAVDSLDAQGSWTYSRDVILPAYKTASGFNDWRMPTRAEVTAAAASDYYGYILEGYVSGSGAPEVTWTSEGSGIYRYYGNLETGQTVKTIEARSSLPLTPVRRVF